MCLSFTSAIEHRLCKATQYTVEIKDGHNIGEGQPGFLNTFMNFTVAAWSRKPPRIACAASLGPLVGIQR